MNQGKNAFWLSLLVIIPIIATVYMVGVVKAHPTMVYVDYYGKSEIYDITLLPPKQFTINITVDYVEDLWGYQFLMLFNPDVLQGVSVENGPFLESAGGTVEVYPGFGFDNTEGVLYIFIAGLFPMRKFPTGGGTLAYVTFEVVGTGGSPLTLGAETGLLNMTGGFELGPTWEPIYGLENPNCLGHGKFDNRPPVYVDPPLVKGVGKDNNFTVDVDVADMQDLYRWEFSMSWNTTLLNVISVVEGDFLKSQPDGPQFYQEIHNDEGYIYANCTRTGTTGVSGSGTLANVTFLVIDERGTCNLTLSNTNLFDSALNLINIRTADGFFTGLKIHEIAITDVTPDTDKVKEGSNETISIDVTVMNVGDYNETEIKVTTYYDENEIGNETIPSLNVGNSTTLTFMWDTTGVHRGRYILSGRAEAETANHTYTYGILSISARDIAIIDVSTEVSNVYEGTNATIKVDVQNQGTEIESFTVTAYYDGNEIDSVNVVDLDYEETRSLTFKWDTTGVPLGEYTISANATAVEDEEDTADNTFTKEGKLNVIPLEEEAFPTALFIVVAVPVAIVGATTVFYVRRRKRPPPEILE